MKANKAECCNNSVYNSEIKGQTVTGRFGCMWREFLTYGQKWMIIMRYVKSRKGVYRMVFNTGAALLDAIVLAVVSSESEGTYGYKITQGSAGSY